MASPRGVPPMLEEALGLGLTPGSETEEAVSADGAYYLERVTITEASEDDCEYEEIPDDNFSIPEGEEDLAKAIHIVQEQATDTQILEQKTVLPSRHVAHEAIEDFLCNFLIKMGMARTLDCFQAECKAREDLLKTQKERDFHRMHHKRIVQEKNKLISDLKGLRLHYASYEPTIRVLHEKHHTLLKEKMLTSLERDRAVWKVSALQATLNNIDLGSLHVPLMKVGSSCAKENKSECSAQKSLQTREENGYKPKMKDDRKASFDSNEEGTSKLSARSGLWPTPCILQQGGRGNSQIWNKTTPLQGTISKNHRSAGASRTPRPCQLEPRERF